MSDRLTGCVVMRLKHWDTLEVNTFLPLQVTPDRSALPGIGYLIVYASRADAEADYPEGPFAEIQEAQP